MKTCLAPAKPSELLAITAMSLPLLDLNADRETFLRYFDNSWGLTELLFKALKNEAAYIVRPYHKLRHPMIFYYGHPVTLYVNKLRLAGLLQGPVDAKMEQLFETGVDEMRWDELYEKEDVWPVLEEVRNYRKQAYDVIRGVILTHPGLALGHAPITQADSLWALVMAFEHERIHLETSSVLMRELPAEYVTVPEQWPANIGYQVKTSITPASGKDYSANEMRALPAQHVTIGKPQNFPSFGWDNEYGQEKRHVKAFRASKQLISNGEFYAFVMDGGYHDASYWSAEGWQWRGFRNSKSPAFWVPEGPSGLHHYKLRTCFAEIPMQWDWPAIVNYHEAKAYAAWQSKRDNVDIPYRMLTEGEHHALRAENEEDTVMTPDVSAYNFNFTHGSESPVNAFPANEKGFHDVFGNVWQWLEDNFHPLNGFKAHPFYADFSEPCYDGEHQLIMGGSFISTGDLASKFARFHFRPHFFQHAGFRLAQSIEGPASGNPKTIRRKNTSAYDTEAMVNTYMLMHWGTRAEIYDSNLFNTVAAPQVVELPIATAELVRRHSKNFDNALDLGCAVGRSAFEMARDFSSVTGIDWSQPFVDAAHVLQQKGKLGYFRKDQGDIGVHLTAKVDESIDRARLNFQQGDACALPENLGAFDAVLLANLLCRLRTPLDCLNRLQGKNAIVKRGGIVVMTTPLSWLEEYTVREHWLMNINAIAEHLTEFELLETQELPFIIREHRRKFEYIVTQASVWQRK